MLYGTSHNRDFSVMNSISSIGLDTFPIFVRISSFLSYFL